MFVVLIQNAVALMFATILDKAWKGRGVHAELAGLADHFGAEVIRSYTLPGRESEHHLVRLRR